MKETEDLYFSVLKKKSFDFITIFSIDCLVHLLFSLFTVWQWFKRRKIKISFKKCHVSNTQLKLIFRCISIDTSEYILDKSVFVAGVSELSIWLQVESTEYKQKKGTCSREKPHLSNFAESQQIAEPLEIIQCVSNVYVHSIPFSNPKWIQKFNLFMWFVCFFFLRLISEPFRIWFA